MKRQSDGWVNATHILKVANFDKPQRTRILEREVQRGTHEKIQGGYGKYQGTWVPLDRAKAIAEQYKVNDVLDPLFEYSPSGNSPTPFAPRHTWKSRSSGAAPAGGATPASRSGSVATPVSTRRGGRQSSNVIVNGDEGEDDVELGSGLKRPHRVLSTGRNISSTITDESMLAPPPTKKRRGRPPLNNLSMSSTSSATIKKNDSTPRKYRYGIPPTTPKQNSMSNAPTGSARQYDGGNGNGSFSPDSSSISSRSSSPSDFMSESDIDAALTNSSATPTARNAIIASSSKLRTPSMITDSPQFNYNGYEHRHYSTHDRYQETPQQRQQSLTNSQRQLQQLQQHQQQLQEHQQQQQQLHQQQQNTQHALIQQHTHERNKSTTSASSDILSTMYSNKLLDYFTSIDEAEIPQFLINPPAEFKINQVIDDEGHTAFHWACSMGDLKIIEVLLKAGADISSTNFAEQTPLIRAILFTNNYDRRTFPKVVDLLRDTILYVDSHKQTVLHHIASTTSSRSKLSSTRYYIEIILAKLLEIKSLQVVTDFVNLQDENGDTALHIAARNGARKCVKVLVHYNALTNIVNNNGRTTQEYISEYEAQRQQLLKQADSLAHVKSSSSPIQISGSNGGPPLNGYGQVPNGNSTDKYLLTSTPNSRRRYLNIVQSQELSNSNYRDMNGSTPAGIASPTNGHIYSSIGNPHASEVAIRATQRVAPSIIEHLEELALAYDAELHEKDSDVEQVRHLLETMKQDIADTDKAINELQELSGDEHTVKSRLQQANELVNSRAVQLRKILERTQARDLAMVVQIEEDRASSELQGQISADNKVDTNSNTNGTKDSSDIDGKSTSEQVISLASTLVGLQESRVKLVDEIVELCASAGAGEKMNDYRRLVSRSCGVKFEEIDDLLDGIAQALLTDSGSDDFQRDD